jgi:hypothetical protein
MKMKTSFRTALIAAVVSAVVAAGAAVAAVTAFNLNTTANTVTAATGAHGSIGGNLFTFTDNSTQAGAPLALTNNSTATGSTALKLSVTTGKAPFTVNSARKVTDLNADKLDGIDSTGFVTGGGRVVTGRYQLPLGSTASATALLDQSKASSPFVVTARCADNADANIGFRNASTTATAEVIGTRVDPAFTPVVDAWHTTVGPQASTILEEQMNPPAAQENINAWWYTGHMADIRVFTYALYDQPDPRDDGCYFQVVATEQ